MVSHSGNVVKVVGGVVVIEAQYGQRLDRDNKTTGEGDTRIRQDGLEPTTYAPIRSTAGVG